MKMADYSMVKEKDGKVCGFWLHEPEYWLQHAHGQGALKYPELKMLVIKHSLHEDVFQAIMNGKFRIVPNTFDDKGGVFLMFDSTPAHSEKTAPDPAKKWWQFRR